MTRTNYRSTFCSHCETRIEAYEGVYDWGSTTCADRDACDARREAADARQQLVNGEMQRMMNDREFVPTTPEVAARRAPYWAMKDERDSDPKVLAQRARVAAEDAALAKRGLVRCDRCGGAGRSDQWWATGYACYKCEGHGSVAA